MFYLLDRRFFGESSIDVTRTGLETRRYGHDTNAYPRDFGIAPEHGTRTHTPCGCVLSPLPSQKHRVAVLYVCTRTLALKSAQDVGLTRIHNSR